MKSKCIFYLLPSLFLLSCTKYFSLNTEQKRHISIVGFIKANDTVRIRLSFNGSSYDFNTFENIENAKVFLFENNHFKELLDYNKLYQYYQTKTFIPQNNKKYSIKVYVSGFDTLYAETYTPEIKKIDSSKVSFYKNEDKFVYFNYCFFFKDIFSSNDYYSYNINQYFSTKDLIIITKDNNGDYINLVIHGYDASQALFNDRIINGKNYGLSSIIRIYLYQDTLKDTNLITELNNLSIDVFKYFYSTYLCQKQIENPLTEPVQIYSNIKNGTGIFAGYSSYSDTITITKEMLQLKITN